MVTEHSGFWNKAAQSSMRRILYAHAAGIANLRLGTFIEGAPECELMNSGLAEMGHFYDLPVLKAALASDVTNLMAGVKAVGPGGHFLAQWSTRDACRSEEFLHDRLFDRNTHEHRVELGMSDVYDKTRERVDEILSGPLKNPLPDEVIGKFEDTERKIDGSSAAGRARRD